jgi:hypothetical protein
MTLRAKLIAVAAKACLRFIDPSSHVLLVVRLSGHVGAPRDADTAKYLSAR